MKKNTIAIIRDLLTNIDFADKTAVMAELDNELNKGAAEKAQKVALYEVAWPVVAAVLADLSEPATAAEIFTECGDRLPDGFGQGSLGYALRAVWADRVRKIPGKPNTYALA